MDALALARHHQPDQTRAFAGKVAEDVDGAPNFSTRLRKGLAFLARHLFGKLFELAVENFGHFEQVVAARRRGAGGPRRMRTLGGGSSGGNVGRRATREQAYYFIDVRRVAIFEYRPVHPNAVNVIAEPVRTHSDALRRLPWARFAHPVPR